MDSGVVGKYYDESAAKYVADGVNERIFSLFQKMKKLGLNTHASILELGCGIGALTFLLSKVVKKGMIEAVDISPVSINFAKEKVKKRNIQFTESDILNYIPKQGHYSFITLFDVIEHIPLEKHDLLFRKVQNYMNEETLLLINIPNPRYTEFDRIYQPQLLQIIDETVYLDDLAAVLYNHDLYIHLFQTSSVWVKDDYQFMIIRKNTPFKEINLSGTRKFSEKVVNRLKGEYVKYFYKF